MWRLLSRLQTEQPLLLFLALGAALFAADAALRRGAPPPAADGPAIVVGGEHARILLERFPDAAERAPGAAELREALGRWIEEEALVVEARAIGLDAGDVIVRRRLAQKMRAILEQLHPVPEPDDETLRARLEADPTRYGHPPTLGFEHVFLSRGRHGEKLDEEARALLARLRGGADFRGLGDAAPTGPVASGLGETEVSRRYGGAFTAALAGLPIGAWQGPIASSLGAHLVRVTGRTPFRAAALEEARAALLRDHRVARREELDRAAIDAILERIAIRIETPEAGE